MNVLQYVPEYVIGSPLFERMSIQLENGKQLVIEADATDYPYVQNVQINHVPHQPLFFTHEQLVKGAFIQFEMTNTPKETQVEFDVSKTVKYLFKAILVVP